MSKQYDHESQSNMHLLHRQEPVRVHKFGKQNTRHRDSLFQQKYRRGSGGVSESRMHELREMLIHNWPMSNGELLAVLVDAAQEIEENVRENGACELPDLITLRLYQALEIAEQELEHSEYTTSMQVPALPGQFPYQTEGISYLRSLTETVLDHDCRCSVCNHNRVGAMAARNFLFEVEAATSIPLEENREEEPQEVSTEGLDEYL